MGDGQYERRACNVGGWHRHQSTSEVSVPSADAGAWVSRNIGEHKH